MAVPREVEVADGSPPRGRLGRIAAQLAEPRARPIKMLSVVEGAHGAPFGEELRAWVRAFEAYELEVCDPGGVELRVPTPAPTMRGLIEDHSVSWLADFIGFFCASSVVVQDDETSFVTTWASTESGFAKVFHFHPHDWGIWPADDSLTARLSRLLLEVASDRYRDDATLPGQIKKLEKIASRERLDPSFDPVELFPRTNWLTRTLLGVGPDWNASIKLAAPLGAYERERDLFPSAPHLATYWLWSHYFFANDEALADAMLRAASSTNAIVRDTLALVAALSEGEPIKLGGRDGVAFSGVRDKVRALAPSRTTQLAPSDVRLSIHPDAGPEERKAQSALQSAAADDPLVAEALSLIEHLSQGGAASPGTIALHGGLDVGGAMERLAELVDERFSPLIVARMRRAAKVPDAHRDASWGLMMAWSRLAPSFAAFEAELQHAGTDQLGPRRRTEMFRAYANFTDTQATEVLAEGTRAWVAELDDWIRMSPVEPFLRLLERDTLATHEAIAAVLERASFSAANFDVCVQAAEMAGELRVTRAARGLRRAIERKLGRVEDGSRARIVRALASVEGEHARDFLTLRFHAQLVELRQSDIEDGTVLRRDLACLLSGLLGLDSSVEHAQAWTKRLIEEQLVRLNDPALRRTAREMAIAVCEALLAGIQLGEVRALKDTVGDLANLEVNKLDPAAVRLGALVDLAGRLRTELS